MFMIDTADYKDDPKQPGHRWAIVGPGFFHEIWDKKEADSQAEKLGNSTRVSGAVFRRYRTSAQAGMRG